MKKTLFILSAILMVALVLFAAQKLLDKPSTSTGAAQIGGEFTLQDSDGHIIHSSNFHGRLMLVYFGFTYCPDICPLGLETISQAITLLGANSKKVQPLFITIDPERDTAMQMKNYMQHFNPAIKGLTGTKEQIAQAAGTYRVYYNKAPGAKEGEYMMDHSAFIYLMDKKGRYITHFAHNASAEEIAAAIKKNW